MIVKRITLTFLSVLSLFTIFPLVLIIVLTLSLLRECAIHFAKKKGWIPLSIHSCATVTDDIYGEPRANYLLAGLLEGPIFEQELRNRLQALVDNKALRPELTMNLTRWMGTFFWEPCQSFNFDDHVQLNRNCRNPSELQEVFQKELATPFTKGKPLWKFIAFPNYQDPDKNIQSAIALKCHHTLTDGFGATRLIQDVLDPDQDIATYYDEALRKFKSKMRLSVWEKVLFYLQLVFLVPIQTFYLILDVLLSNSNSWTVPFKNQAKAVTISYKSDGLDISQLKEIAKNCNQSVSTIIFDAVTSAMSRCMGNHGKDFTVAYPLPNPAHPGTLTNCMVPMMMKAPISIKNRQQRQNQIAKQFRFKTSTAFPLGVLGAVYVECLLTSLFNREIGDGNFIWSSAMFSNFVISSAGRPFHLFDSKLTSILAVTGTQRKFNSAFVATLSYNGKLNFLVTADKKIFPNDEDARRFLDCIMDEFRACEGKKLP